MTNTFSSVQTTAVEREYLALVDAQTSVRNYEQDLEDARERRNGAAAVAIEQGWTIAQIARAFGVSRAAVSKMVGA